MVTKKIRTEYMKKFRDPRWETFSKCYEDSLKYRLSRRMMESSHKPWIWEGWDNGSDSSGRSTPRLTRNKVLPLSVAKPSTSLGVKHGRSSDSMTSAEPRSTPEPKPPFENGEPEVQAKEVALCSDAAPTENGVVSTTDAPNTTSDDTATEDGPLDRVSSDEEPVKPEPKRRHRQRTPRSEPGHRESSHDDKPAAGIVRKSSRAKSQPPVSNKEKENRRPLCRYDWTEKHSEVKKVPNETRAPDVRAQTRRESDKRASNVERRRARSADLEKLRKSELTVVDDRWITEYMRCFSARLR